MPLIKSRASSAVGKNIETEMAHGKPRRQAIAIALSVQRRAGGGKNYMKRGLSQMTSGMYKRGM